MSTISAAGRLLAILKQAVGQPGPTLVFQTWAKVFELDPADRAAVFQAIAGVHRLIDDARDEVRSHPELTQELYLGALGNIETAVTGAQLGNQWGQHSGSFQGSNIIALEFVAEQLDRFSSEAIVDRVTLSELREAIEIVIAEVLNSDIDTELKRVLVHKLEDARRAVLFYTIDGADGLRRAGEAAVGAIIVTRESTKTEQSKKAFGDYIDVVNKIFDVVAKAKPYAVLLKPVVRALLGSGS